MRMNSKVVVLLLSIVLVFTTSACFGSSAEGLITQNVTADVERAEEHEVGFTETYTWSIGSATASTTLNKVIADYIADYLDKRSNGKIVVNTYFDGALGSDSELMNELYNRGAVDFYSAITATMSNYASVCFLFDQYYLFTNTQQYYDMFSQEGFMDWINEKAAEGGIRIMCLNPVFFRHLLGKKPMTAAEDVQGLKIRTTLSTIHLAFWETLGTNPTVVELSELFTALQQGVVDAAENSYQNYTGGNFHQVLSHVIETGHCLHNMALVMNAQVYAELPPAVRKLLDEACAAASAYANSIAKTAEQQYKQLALDAGNTIITWDQLDESFKEALYKSAAAQKPAIVEKVGQETWDEFYNWAKPFNPNI